MKVPVEKASTFTLKTYYIAFTLQLLIECFSNSHTVVRIDNLGEKAYMKFPSLHMNHTF